MNRILRLLAAIVATAGLLTPALAGEWHFNGVQRVVALSDVHGAYDAMLNTLREAQVIDGENDWSGGETHLVVTGDLLDRGPDSRSAMDLLMRLEHQAIAAGGRVHVLIGNHEAMNLTGDLRYVSLGEYSRFADEETADERKHWRDAIAARGQELNVEAFDARFPRGFFAHRRAFRADGQYGEWLLEKPVIVVINGTAFVHGGIHPNTAELGLDVVNERLVGDLADYVTDIATLTDAGVFLPDDGIREQVAALNAWVAPPDTSPGTLDAVNRLRGLQDSSLAMLDEPLWYRGNVGCSEVIEARRLERALQAIGASRVVIGHTPTDSRQVLQRFDGMIVEIDTGMLNAYYEGKGHALIIEGDDLSVVSQAGTRFDDPLPHPRRVGDRPKGMTAGDIETLLATGEVLSRQETEFSYATRTTVEVSDGSDTIRAIFLPRPRRGFYPNVAAYRLDRLLGLGMVPVAALREVDGKQGSLHFLPAKTIDEQRRSSSGYGAGAWCPLNDQWQAMYVFDALIYNEGRSLERMLYATDRFKLILIEHQNAFANRKGVPRHLENAGITITEGWRDVLSSLSREVLQQELGDVLDKGRLRALDSRRKNLLSAAESP
ncbi:MAG: metallophosphoesterase [Woeseiaceae bacterium]|nr:metallophosphoesterase [Woeseiaceae bacterium]